MINPANIKQMQSDHQKDVAELVSNLQKPYSSTKLDHVTQVLASFFKRFSFDLAEFTDRFGFSKAELRRYFSYLLRDIFYNANFFSFLQSHSPKYYLEALLFCLMAEVKMKKGRLQQILSSLSEAQQCFLVTYCCNYSREGTWVILDQLEALHANESSWTAFLFAMRNKYYDSKFLESYLYTTPTDSISSLITELEKHADQQIHTISKILPELIETVVTLPMRGFDILERMKKEIDPESSESFESKKAKETAKHIQSELNHHFAQYRNVKYTHAELEEFFKVFGLQGQYLDVPLSNEAFLPVSEILERLFKLLQNPIEIQLTHINYCILFVLSLCRQLYIYYHEPVQYVSGLKEIVFAIPTRGKNFSDLQWLPSVVKGLNFLQEYLQKKRFSNQNNPNVILIFDQAKPKYFAQNKAYIKNIKAHPNIVLWHLSIDQTLALAKKLDVLDWLITTSEGEIGFGGSRNSVYFLAPVIYAAIRMGKKSMDEVLLMGDKDLCALFDRHVLGRNGQDVIVYMGDDDVAIPACNFFVYALHAALLKDQYFSRDFYCVGRATHIIRLCGDSRNVFAHPEVVFHTSRWDAIPELGAMKGMLSKPKFCLPVPFGNEERHVNPPSLGGDLFYQPIVHLGGSRYPRKSLPLSPFDGLVEYIKSYVPYSVQMGLSSCLLDSANDFGKCALPWNDDNGIKVSHVSSLDELWAYIFDPKVLDEMHDRFWKNVYDLFDDAHTADFPIGNYVRSLQFYDPNFPVPIALKKYYEVVQLDAFLFFAVGKAIVKHHKAGAEDFLDLGVREGEYAFQMHLKDAPLTKSLCTFIRCIDGFYAKFGVR